jgi:hypothetical protein
VVGATAEEIKQKAKLSPCLIKKRTVKGYWAMDICNYKFFLTLILASPTYGLGYTSKETSVEATENEATTQFGVK